MNKFVEKEEVRSFRPNQNIIYHLIKSQNSTPISAIKELIQNSHDAKSNNIQLDFYTDENTFVIKDNGNGFKNREEIESFFEEFGKAHEEEEYIENEKFGRFRMGRCQIMAYASTLWRSGNFSMRVDIKNNGLDYILTEHEEYYKGCEITGEWYSYDWESIEGRYSQEYYIEKLKKECKYLTNCNLFIDDELVNHKIDKDSYSFEDEYFIFIKDKINSKQNYSNSNVYNLGIFTESINLNNSGTIITKKHLTLDISRKHIDRNCKIYSHIINTIEALYGNKKLKTKKRLNSNEKIEYFINFLNKSYSKKEINWNNISEIFLFSNYTNTKYHTLENLRTKKYVLVSDRTDRNNDSNQYQYNIDKIDQSNLFLIVDTNEIVKALKKHNSNFEASNNFAENINDEEAFFKIINSLYLNKETLNKFKQNNVSLESALKSISSEDEYSIINEKDLNNEQLASFKAIETAHRNTIEYIEFNYNRKNTLIQSIIKRKIVPGYSNGKAAAWTDGHSYIYIDLNLLNLYKEDLNKLTFILIHEYCHDNTSNTHDSQFYYNFHVLTCDNTDIYNTLRKNLVNAYRARLNYYKINIPSNIEVKTSTKNINKKLELLEYKNSNQESFLIKNMKALIKNKLEYNCEIPEDIIKYFNQKIKSIKRDYYNHIRAVNEGVTDYYKNIENNYEALYLQILREKEGINFINKLKNISNIDITKTDEKNLLDILNQVFERDIKYYKIEIINNKYYTFWQFYDIKTTEVPKEYIDKYNKDTFNHFYGYLKALYPKTFLKINLHFSVMKINFLQESINIPANLNFSEEINKIKNNIQK